MVLRYGEMIPLVAKHARGWHKQVLAYARFSMAETAIIATNLNDADVIFHFDFSNLQKVMKQQFTDTSIIVVSDWLADEEDSDSEPNYYFLKEFLSLKETYTLTPYKSMMLGVAFC